ncbi:MAG: hypothetical protein ACREBU_03000 [Nitrososphaera sp.]
MPIEARISRFKTRPYEPQEIAGMDATEYERIKASGYEKLLDEEVVDEFVAEDLGQLRDRTSRIAEACKPDPIIVKVPDSTVDLSIKHSFLITRAYLPDDSDGIFETIIFRPKDPEAYQEKMRKGTQKFEARRATPAEQQEFMENAVKSIFEESAKTFASSYEKTLKKLGFANNNEFGAYFVGIESKRGNFSTEEQFQQFYAAEWKKRTDEARARHRAELAGKPPYWAGRLSSVLNDEMTVLCRIIGRDRDLVYKHQQYYRNFHNISDPAFSVDNGADDGLAVSFVYGKDFAGRKP